ncbi:homoprotocatechuate degradation operon regulator HpaR [Ottowia sp.]|uniref:homoprotocatechuate degradation operon regulator HpaR n=2 Tax=Ottowia sp. TaxID=1898956 RepID=UPI002D19DAB3|nr:homoprotocatechuate degradation operon regulator HpaR [Ottowia sp.]HPZ57084.1 homoprotocatechuate degradation operon regulator HpaR [Ottowia sp.]HQD48666.1 homoprotocatechuate degradation operon regulator HpaR [Ottowia sp.]
MPRHPPFVHRNLPLLLLKARESLMQSRRPALRGHGLSDQQWRVLRVLADPAHASGLDTGRLAREAHLLGPSLTGMLARMEQGGLLLRQRCPMDARRSVVRATEDGLALAASLAVAIEAQYDELDARLGRPKLAQLYQLLDEVIELNPNLNEEKDTVPDEATLLTEAAA